MSAIEHVLDMSDFFKEVCENLGIKVTQDQNLMPLHSHMTTLRFRFNSQHVLDDQLKNRMKSTIVNVVHQLQENKCDEVCIYGVGVFTYDFQKTDYELKFLELRAYRTLATGELSVITNEFVANFNNDLAFFPEKDCIEPDDHGISFIRQTCNFSCGFAAIAMIAGRSLDEVKSLLPDWSPESGGVTTMQALALMSQLGYVCIPMTPPFALQWNMKHLCTVQSLNKINSLHFIVISIDASGNTKVYDPNIGREGFKTYDTYETTPVIECLRVYDVAKILNGKLK